MLTDEWPEPSERRRDSPRAWRMVAAAFVSTFTIFGIAYSFGAFFASMAAEFGTGRGATSAVFSITAFLYFLFGLWSGRASDRFGPRPVLFVGAAAFGTGLLLTSWVDRIEVAYVTYGLGVGIGVACGYVPMVALVGGWFERSRAMALGVAVSGIGIGTLAVAPLAASLVERYGWRTTFQLFAAASALVLTLCALVVDRPPVAVTTAETPRLGEVIRTRAFASLYAASLLMAMALFVPFVFLPAFAESHGIDPVAAARLVGLIGAASVAGRLGLGFVADRFGGIPTYLGCFVLMAASFAIWLVGESYMSLVVFTLVLGVGYGGYIALSPAVVVELFGVAGLGQLIGATYTSAALGSLVGTPIAGFVIDATGSYTAAIVLAMVLAASAAGALLPLARRR
jgi:MFS family permease